MTDIDVETENATEAPSYGRDLARYSDITVYASFGMIRGRASAATAQSITRTSQKQAAPDSIIEIDDVTVEHYSNHLPTESYQKLFVRSSDVLAFALQGSGNQT